MDEPQLFPWVMAVLAAGWFGFVGWRRKAGWKAWASLGAGYGLVAAACIFGLLRAAHIPLSETSDTSMSTRGILLSLVLILLPGGVLLWRGWTVGDLAETQAGATTPRSSDPGRVE